ncbi:hypothetical protein ACYJW8_05360 [Frateuria aurantia]
MPGTSNPSTPSPESGPALPGEPSGWQPLGRSPHSRDTARRPLARILGLVVTLLLHALFFMFAWVELRPHRQATPVPPPDTGVLQVQLLSAPPRQPSPMAEPAKAPAAAPPPAAVATAKPSRPPEHLHQTPPPPPKPVKVVPSHEATRPGEMTASMPAKPPSTAHLFDADGNPVLPTEMPKPAVKPDQYIARNQQGDTQILQQNDPTHYQATRFDASWHRPGAVDRAVQKAVKDTSVGHTFHLPGGVRIHCTLSLAAMGGGCGGDPPPPPSKKDGDERLSLPPPSLLAKNPHAPKPPSVESCIADYRADKPLAPGCPFDIPQRAVDQEAKERAEQERRRTQWGH